MRPSPETQRLWYLRNRARAIYNAKCWSQQNPEQRRRIASNWGKKNPDKVMVHRHNRRARLEGSQGTYTPEQIEQLFIVQEGYCNNPYCLEDLIFSGFQKDHIVAIVNGGTNSIENLQLLCPKCNRRKHKKSWEQFLKEEAA
jgi:5-methylcytosine-specific restriction endonuclease McrA